MHAAKIAKYLCAILHEFGIPQEGLTLLYEDNISAIAMINEHKPTPNSRHIDIQHFAIQEWQHHGIIIMHHPCKQEWSYILLHSVCDVMWVVDQWTQTTRLVGHYTR